MTAPRRELLEHNLARLFARAYRPVRPAPEFVARLERRLAPWIAPPAARWSGATIAYLAAGLAAAAVVLFAWLPRGAQRSVAPGGELEAILATGAGAIRAALVDEPWFALSPDGRAPSSGPGRAWARGREVELAAPPEQAVRWSVEGHAEFVLGADARLLARRDGALDIVLALEQGALGFELDARSGLFAAADELKLRLQPGARGELAFVPPAESPAPHLDAADPGERATRLRLLAGGGTAQTPRRSEALTAPVELWVHGGRFVRAAGDDPAAPGESATERTALAEPTPGSAADPTPPAERASLVGQVALPAGVVPPIELRVVLLRAVPLPAVAWPESRTFTLGVGPGTFRWEGLEPGTYLVQVAADGLAPAVARGVVLAAGEERGLELALESGARIFGHVVDGRTGAPLEGALVVSETDAPVQVLGLDPRELPAELRAWTRTGPDGRFELAALSSGAQRLRASHPEHAPRWLDAPHLGAAEERGGLLFELGPGGALEGRVERNDGAPEVGAELIASHVSGAGGHGLMTYSSARTDAEGRYRIPHLAPGSYVVLEVGASADAEPRDLRPRFAFATVREGELARVDFLAPAGGPVFAGRLLDGEGQPLARGVVQLVPRRDGTRWAGEEEMLSSAIEADGSFVLSGLAPGAYAVYVGRGDATVLRDLLELRPGERTERTYRLAGEALEGRALCAEQGLPLERVVIVARSVEPLAIEGGRAPTQGDLIAAKAWTGADGRFRIDDLAPGRYVILALDEDGARALTLARDVALPGPPLELRMPQAGELELEVTDGAGAPLAGARIELVDPLGAPLGAWFDLLTDAQGRARARRLAPGRWTLGASRDGLRSGPLGVDVVPGAARGATLVLLPD